jgi:hypothetical protein
MNESTEPFRAANNKYAALKLRNPTNIKENRGKYLLDKQLA